MLYDFFHGPRLRTNKWVNLYLFFSYHSRRRILKCSVCFQDVIHVGYGQIAHILLTALFCRLLEIFVYFWWTWSVGYSCRFLFILILGENGADASICTSCCFCQIIILSGSRRYFLYCWLNVFLFFLSLVFLIFRTFCTWFWSGSIYLRFDIAILLASLWLLSRKWFVNSLEFVFHWSFWCARLIQTHIETFARS